MREGDGAAQQARVADRLDRGDFGVQRREKTLPIYHCGPFQPAANAQAVSWHNDASLIPTSFKVYRW